MLRFKFFLLFLMAAFVGAALVLSLLLQRFDVSRYRETLQDQLSAALSQPVTLGQAHFTLRQGLSIELDDLRIGSPEPRQNSLEVRKLLLKLSLWELFFNRIEIRDIRLEAPHLKLCLHTAAPSAPAEKSPVDIALLRGIDIRLCSFTGARISLSDYRRESEPHEIKVQDLQGSLYKVSAAGIDHFTLSGNLVDSGPPAPFSLEGEVHPPPDFINWRQVRGHANLRIENFNPHGLIRRYALPAHALRSPGQLSAQAHLSGSAAEGARFELSLTGQNFTAPLPGYAQPPQLKRLTASGLWRARDGKHTMDELSAVLNGISLGGRLSLEQKPEGPWIEGSLKAPAFALKQALAWVPDDLAQRSRRISAGTLSVEELHVDGPASWPLTPAELPLRSASVHVQGLDLDLPSQAPLRSLSVQLEWKPPVLRLGEGRGLLDQAPFSFSGTVALRPEAPAELGLAFEGVVPEGLLTSLNRDHLKNAIGLKGHLPLKAEIKGPPQDLFFDLTSDLTGLEIGRENLFSKPQGMEGTLFLTGRLRPETLELSHSRLHLPWLELRANGKRHNAPGHPFELSLDLETENLEKLIPLAPPLGKISPTGKLSLRYNLKGGDEEPLETEGVLSLREFGMPLGRVIAPLKGVSGQIHLKNADATFKDVHALLGQSPTTVSGSFRAQPLPQLELRVLAPSIRANELIFPSEKAMLRQVDGRLLISGDRIEYAPIRVKLDGGTDAVVTGKTENFSSPLTTLEIDAAYGNIDEVIELWRRPDSPANGQPPTGNGRSNPLNIKVRAAKGRLHRLHFDEASGHIALIDGNLVISPVNFKALGGLCNAEIRLQHRPQAPSLLQIKGDVEGMSTQEIFKSILQTRSLTSGTLAGKFQLSGEPGARFLATSQGSFSFGIHEGVLHRFDFLSKVFSLLNVSQILTLRLPEMDTEGMPFKSLSADADLRLGVLHTENFLVKSQSMNLTLVGDLDLRGHEMDMLMGVQPLRTVDKVITHIPIAGWILAGEEKSLITAQFEIKGKASDPQVTAIPIQSLSSKVIGIFKRLLKLPEKMVTDPGTVLQGK